MEYKPKSFWTFHFGKIVSVKLLATRLQKTHSDTCSPWHTLLSKHTNSHRDCCHRYRSTSSLPSSHHTWNPKATDMKIISGKNKSFWILANEKHAYFKEQDRVGETTTGRSDYVERKVKRMWDRDVEKRYKYYKIYFSHLGFLCKSCLCPKGWGKNIIFLPCDKEITTPPK